MNIKKVLFIIACTIYAHESLSVIIQIDTLSIQKDTSATPNPVKIILFADKHKRTPGEQEQITTILNFLQEQKDSHHYHILIEQASKFCKSLASSYEILYTLDKHLEQAKPSLAHVVFDNVEIRHITGVAIGILNYYDFYKSHSRDKFDEVSKMLGAITFEDVFNEFDNIKKMLAKYYASHTNQAISTLHGYYIETANEHYEEWRHTISRKSETILEYAKRMSNTEKEGTLKVLSKAIEWTFNPLFDLNLLKNILISKSSNILVFAGGDHTSALVRMLHVLDAKSMYYVKNSVIEEVTRPNGLKTLQEVNVLPITASQITQAFSDAPQPTFMATHYPKVYIAGLSSIGMALYWVYNQCKATDEAAEEENSDTKAENATA